MKLVIYSLVAIYALAFIYAIFQAGRNYERNQIESVLKSQGAVWVGNLTNHGVVQEK